MKGGARIAIGVGIGYVLGRTRKMRFALALAGAAMTRRSAGTPGDLLERGTSLLRSSPELTQITDTVKGELVGAVRSAAVTAASHRIDALNARLQQRAMPDLREERGYSREPDSDEGELPEDDLREDEMAEAELDQNEPADDEGGYDEDDSGRSRNEYDDDSRLTSARSRARQTMTAVRRTGARTLDRASGSAERKPPAPRRRRSRVDTDVADEAPVRRTRR
ncbi:hypothetical protein [Nocardia pseudovaccinii]|uniref:hypothetical protein n=1 Tax=Nocardia pseudovaccinii TaxID=189540 RepID=UPI0007C63641|nr:hypothetical protein [Nocardia pseudovaccinii]